MEANINANNKTKAKQFCYLYGNCQTKILNCILSDHPIFKDKYIFHNFYVGDSISTLDIDILSKTQLFIYQYVKSHKLNNTDAPNLDRTMYTVEYIIQNYLPKTCITISFPSIYFNVYWPNVSIIHSESENKPEYLRLQSNVCKLIENTNLPEDEILKAINDPYLIADEDIETSYIYCCESLQKRERDNKIDIPISEYLIENFKQFQLFNIFNHPTIYVFNYLTKKICERLQVPYNNYVLDDQKYIINCNMAYRMPVLPCIMRYFNVNESQFNAPPFYIYGKKFFTDDEYYLYLIRKIRSKNLIIKYLTNIKFDPR
jgi:hypothetical protein